MTQYAMTGGRLVYLRQDTPQPNEIYKCIGCEHRLSLVFKDGEPSHFMHPANSRNASLLRTGELCEQMAPLGKNTTQKQIREYSRNTFRSIKRQIEVGELQAEDLYKLLEEFNETQGSLLLEWRYVRDKMEELDNAIWEAQEAKRSAEAAEFEFNKRALKKEFALHPEFKHLVDKVIKNKAVPPWIRERRLEDFINDKLYGR